MASSKFNKLIRAKAPLVLTQNTTQILNKCIEKIYKQIPNQFKTELETKKPILKPENKLPTRLHRPMERARLPHSLISFNRSSTKCPNRMKAGAFLTGHQDNSTYGNTSSLLRTNSKNSMAYWLSNKKLLKSPNYKIYSTRRYGSSASSSSASIVRREERRRTRMSQSAKMNFLMNSYRSRDIYPIRDMGLNSLFTSPNIIKRNQIMKLSLNHALPAVDNSVNVCDDLMGIDNEIKERIAVGRPVRTSPSKLNCDPMSGWHHPPKADLISNKYAKKSSQTRINLNDNSWSKNINYHRSYMPIRDIDRRASLTGTKPDTVSTLYNVISRNDNGRLSKHMASRSSCKSINISKSAGREASTEGLTKFLNNSTLPKSPISSTTAKPQFTTSPAPLSPPITTTPTTITRPPTPPAPPLPTPKPISTLTPPPQLISQTTLTQRAPVGYSYLQKLMAKPLMTTEYAPNTIPQSANTGPKPKSSTNILAPAVKPSVLSQVPSKLQTRIQVPKPPMPAQLSQIQTKPSTQAPQRLMQSRAMQRGALSSYFAQKRAETEQVKPQKPNLNRIVEPRTSISMNANATARRPLRNPEHLKSNFGRLKENARQTQPSPTSLVSNINATPTNAYSHNHSRFNHSSYLPRPKKF